MIVEPRRRCIMCICRAVMAAFEGGCSRCKTIRLSLHGATREEAGVGGLPL